ncbi:MAG: class I SAM-dependent methyltransferase, partial [Pseudomonadales bacterium]
VVVPVVAPSLVAARHWRTPLGLVFIDGGHSIDAAMNDYHSWADHLVPGGTLAIHDIFEDPKEGGQAPHEILKLARASKHYGDERRVKTLALLTRL